MSSRDLNGALKQAADKDIDGLSRTATVFASAARSGGNNSSAQSSNFFDGGHFFLDITSAQGGAPTLDVKLQAQDPVSSKWVDIPGASFAQKTSTGTSMLAVMLGVKQTSNVGISEALAATYRAVASVAQTSATATFWFSLGVSYLPAK